MIIPLEKRLKKRMHMEIARLQDEIVEMLYGIENGLVLHGGTAIWRCYGGNRFSEDLDFYCADMARIDDAFRQKVRERGLAMLKYKKTASLLFSKISNGSAEVRVEMNFSATKPHMTKSYEKTDGTFMDVFTLSAEELILEKIGAYKGRRFVRDIYDIYHLANYAKGSRISAAMREFIVSMQQPVDEPNIRAIVYSGAIPSFSQLREFLKRRFL
ncbi:MAG: nucleotidyl transferase AbiEii/AbiGii toxin family protein [Candidatus ainarchaeum sp.]|nr:nucleotidyl transferase AbiEii/AbiGii toxin family protein [Candidatus ainarchaeum sp.]